MEEEKLVNAEVQFHALLQNSTGKAAASVLENILEHEDIFSLYNTLIHPNIEALAKESAHKPLYDLLHIFVFGTYSTYLASAKVKKQPQLNEKQLLKLKQLTVIEFASHRKILDYGYLMRELNIPTIRELEDMIIPLLELGLIQGRLNNDKKCLEVQYARGRDVGEEALDEMNRSLANFLNVCEEVVEDLKKQEKYTRERFQRKASENSKFIRSLKEHRAKRKERENDRQKARAGQDPRA